MGSPHREECLQFITKVRLFKCLPEQEHGALADAMEAATFEDGSVIIKQGDEGDVFYVIKSGKCTVEIDGAVVNEVKAGDYFGENALLRNEPRMATIKAASRVETLNVTRAMFEKLGLKTKLEFPKRGAVGCGANVKVETKPPSPKTAEEEKLMTVALRANKNLVSCVDLDDTKINEVINRMWKESVAAGTQIIKQGDMSADYFYIVMEGTFEVLLSDEHQTGQSVERRSATRAGILSPGQSFGELALMYVAPRAATIVAQSHAVVMLIDRLQFKNILAASSMQMIQGYVRYLDKVKILDPLKDEEKVELAKGLHEMVFSKDECIFKQGEKGDYFYILTSGSVSVIMDEKEVTQLQATNLEAQYFGEKALLTKDPRAATIKVTSETAAALTVDKQTFDMLLGPLEELKARGKTGTAEVKKMKLGPAGQGKQHGIIVRRDLKKLGLLGCGGFGSVEMVEHTKTHETYALKQLSKGYVVKSGMQQSVISEKDVQLMCDSRFVVQLYETYNGEQSLYFLLELCQGGELYAIYTKKNLWGREDCARFYVAGTTLAFAHLHSKKIVFRDLKPENLLLNENGHIKLTDMGLAKVVFGKTYTTCGTPDYFAPELIASKGHNHAVDWWTLGILTFELLSGHPPFESGAVMQIYQKVKKGINWVRFPAKCRGVVETLIKGLCNSIPTERLPMKKGSIDNIKHHPYYQGFSWEAMEEFEMLPPYQPVVKHKKDIGNFSARRQDMPPQLRYTPDHSGWDRNFATST